MLDMINPSEPGRIRLKDLKASSLTPIFFDTFFNLEKYLRHEQKDPFSNLRVTNQMLQELLDINVIECNNGKSYYVIVCALYRKLKRKFRTF